VKSILSVKFKFASCSFICGILPAIFIVLSIIGTSWAAFESVLSDPSLRIRRSAFKFQDSDRASLRFNNLRRFDLPELSVNRMDGLYKVGSMRLLAGWAGCGDELYRESKLYLGAGKSFGFCDIEADVGWYSLDVKDFCTHSYFGGCVVASGEFGIFPMLEVGIEAIQAPDIGFDGNVPFMGWSILQLNEWELLSVSGGLIFPGEWDASMMMSVTGMFSSQFGYEFGLQNAPHKVSGGVIVDLGKFQANARVKYQPKLGLEQGIGIGLKF